MRVSPNAATLTMDGVSTAVYSAEIPRLLFSCTLLMGWPGKRLRRQHLVVSGQRTAHRQDMLSRRIEVEIHLSDVGVVGQILRRVEAIARRSSVLHQIRWQDRCQPDTAASRARIDATDADMLRIDLRNLRRRQSRRRPVGSFESQNPGRIAAEGT